MSDRHESDLGQAPTVNESPGVGGRRGRGSPASGFGDLSGLDLQGLEVRECIGRGAMGAVYKAWDGQLERFVAVKVIAAEDGEEERFVSRFLREARAASAVRHPGVAQVHSVGTHEGRPYLVMELIDGQTLADLIRQRGRLSGSGAIDYLIQACEGLEAGHRAGVVHRDIKPGNLMIDRAGQLKIVDFGLARRAEIDVTLTEADTIVGTPGYMSPEQAVGKPLDHRSDIYSLGATFYHALSGRPAFEGETPIEVATQHVTAPLAPLARHNPAIPRPLCAVIERMMAKQPEHRYASCEVLLAQLRSIGAGGSGVSEPVVVVESPRRSPLFVVATVVAALLLGLWLGRPEPPTTPSGVDGARVQQPPPTASGGTHPPAVTPETVAAEATGSEETTSGLRPLEPSDDWALLYDDVVEEETPEPQLGEPRREPPTTGGGDPAESTTETFRTVSAAVDAYRQRYGTLPSDLVALARVDLIGSASPSDGWGSPIHYRREGSDRYHLVSPGADHRPQTDDDLFYDGVRLIYGRPPGPRPGPPPH